MEQHIHDAQVRGFPTTLTPEQLDRARKAEHDRINAAVEARKQRDAQLTADREKATREQGAAQLERERERRRAAFLFAGGSEADFVAAWPALKLEYLASQTAVSREAEIYERMRQSGAKRW